MKQIREKKHRLPAECYQGYQMASFTCCIKDRRAVLTDESIFRNCDNCLLDEAKKHHCDVLLYLFMPDHCHIVLQGTSEDSSVLNAMYGFKRKTGYWFSTNRPDVQWQKDFHDHIIRDDKDISRHIDYILYNPVRKGYVDDWKKYPFRGSSIYNFYEGENVVVVAIFRLQTSILQARRHEVCGYLPHLHLWRFIRTSPLIYGLGEGTCRATTIASQPRHPV